MENIIGEAYVYVAIIYHEVTMKTFRSRQLSKRRKPIDTEGWYGQGDETEEFVSYERAKRLFDLVGSTVLGVALLPVMAGVATVVKLSSHGPVIYRQRRLTKGGQEFMLCKFRTMKVDAESESGAVVAQLHDTRVTPVGRILRKTRLDELPQLWNVVRGEMSLIGPRPERPELAKKFEKKIRGFGKRLGVKAGLTGLAQVIQGYPEFNDGYRQKLALDIVYIKKRSARLDLWIAAKTVGVIVSGSGAR